MRYPNPNRNRFRITIIAIRWRWAAIRNAVRDACGFLAAALASPSANHRSYPAINCSIRLSIFPSICRMRRPVMGHARHVAPGSRDTKSIFDQTRIAPDHQPMAQRLIQNRCFGLFRRRQCLNRNLPVANREFTLAVCFHAGQCCDLAAGARREFSQSDVHGLSGKKRERNLVTAPQSRKATSPDRCFRTHTHVVPDVSSKTSCAVRRAEFKKWAACRLSPMRIAFPAISTHRRTVAFGCSTSSATSFKEEPHSARYCWYLFAQSSPYPLSAFARSVSSRWHRKHFAIAFSVQGTIR